MSEVTSSTQTETKVHEALDPVTKTETNATAQNATDPAKPSLSTSEDMPPSSPKAQIAKNQDGNVAPAANDVGGTTPAKVYSPPKYSETTEKEIRTMMNNARGVKDNNPFTADGDVAKLAMFTTNLVQLLNAEYIVSCSPPYPDLLGMD